MQEVSDKIKMVAVAVYRTMLLKFPLKCLSESRSVMGLLRNPVWSPHMIVLYECGGQYS
jgi:hypothetical protein